MNKNTAISNGWLKQLTSTLRSDFAGSHLQVLPNNQDLQYKVMQFREKLSSSYQIHHPSKNYVVSLSCLCVKWIQIIKSKIEEEKQTLYSTTIQTTETSMKYVQIFNSIILKRFVVVSHSITTPNNRKLKRIYTKTHAKFCIIDNLPYSNPLTHTSEIE